MSEIAALIEPILPEIIALRHALHAEPEPAFEEVKTSRRVAEILKKIPGMTVREGMAGTGVVATLAAQGDAPCIALRADMDALQMQEESTLPYASKLAGRAHACGHDGHVACLVGTAMVLSRLADRLPGPVKFRFQPAEEGGGGGQLLCEEGVLCDPPVLAVFALHGWPHLPIGVVGVREGAAMASTNALHILVKGRGTHAAAPHNGIDPIMISAQIVTALQTIVSRRISPAEPAVVTIGMIHGGTARNVIPEQVTLQGTIRALTEETRVAVCAAVRRIAEQTAAAHGGVAEVTISSGYPVLINHKLAAEFVRQTARCELGAEALRDNIPVSMGGEDFAYYAQQVPCTLFRLGISAPDDPMIEPLHSPRFNFADAALPIGIRMEVALALRDRTALLNR